MLYIWGHQDIEWWRRHKLGTKECISPHGKMKNAGFLNDMKIKDARLFIIEKLKQDGKLVKQTEVIQNVKCAERSGECWKLSQQISGILKFYLIKINYIRKTMSAIGTQSL